MGTLSARAGLTNIELVALSPALPEVRAHFVRQMRKLSEIGADGIHIDKMFFNTGLDFNPRLTVSPDEADHAGMLQAVEEMLSACRAVNPEFAFSYESTFDRLISYSDIMWWAPWEHSILKITFPEWTPHLGITQPFAFNQVNYAMLRGQNLLVGPRNYCGGMDYPPHGSSECLHRRTHTHPGIDDRCAELRGIA